MGMATATIASEAQWLLRKLHHYAASAACALALATTAGLVSTLDPLLMRHLIDHSLPSKHLVDSLVCVAIIALCFVGRSVSRGWLAWSASMSLNALGRISSRNCSPI
jgi:hypothetical protein